MILKRILITALVLIISIPFAQATHLVGGEMTYVRLAGNSIRVTLMVYRDNVNGQAPFDGDQSVPNSANCVISFYSDNGNFLEAIEVSLDSVQLIDIELQPCQEEIPGFQTQVGTYIFDVDLNSIAGYNPLEGITLLYGRCCRTGIINNLNQPASRGFSILVRVPPILIQNSSPIFNNFEQYLCVNRFNQVDFSATDPDGDSLYYSLCDPYLGLSTNTPVGDAFNLNIGGTYSNYGPPYNTVPWEIGFSSTNPLGGTMSLDGFTGIMDATPMVTGIFVMGVCVSEYRNGVLLSTVSRDFQYLVSACEFPELQLMVNLSLPVDSATGLFIINEGCDQGLVSFNLSKDSGIENYLWDFGDPGSNTDTSTLQNPSYLYADTGSFVVTVIGFDSDGCAVTSQGLVVFSPSVSSENAPDVTACDSALVNGNWYYASQTVVDSYSPSTVCDSVVLTDLTIYYSSAVFAPDLNFCDSVLFNGTPYYNSQIVIEVLSNSYGCDSVISTNLVFNQTSYSELFDTIFTGLSYSLPGGDIVFNSGIYIDTLQTSNNCDSIVTTNLFAEDNVGLTNVSQTPLNWNVFPNPGVNYIEIEIEESIREYQIEIISILGKEVYRSNNNHSNSIIQTAGWVPGVYIVRLKDRSGYELGAKIVMIV